MDNKEGFTYTYSAQQRQEVEAIRSKYTPRREDKMDRLRRLHRSASTGARIWAVSLGVAGTLLLGTGMSLIMTDLGAALGSLALVLGLIAGVAGLGLAALAYPVYNHVLQKNRDRIAPEILSLTDELLG